MLRVQQFDFLQPGRRLGRDTARKGSRICTLDNEVQHYAWGSPRSIPEMLGVDNSQAEPWAELWMGAHPKAPSLIHVAGRRAALDEVIAADSTVWLGEQVAAAFDGRLPFLLKLLAAETPLSIQVHPDEAQARAGFAREEEQGIDRAASVREYPDPHAKPELVVALQPFEALQGFREAAEIVDNFSDFGLADSPGFAGSLASLRAHHGESGLRRFVASWLQLAGREREQALSDLDDNAAQRKDPLAATVRRLLQLYPGDVGVFAPLILNLVSLAPGEGLFLGAREPHAYLSGFAIELCAASDNVLRGGLTPKHVDVTELLSVLRCEPQTPRKLRPQPAEDGLSVYPTATRYFRLACASVSQRDGIRRSQRTGVEIVLCTRGNVTLTTDDGQPVPLRGGSSALVPGRAPEYLVRGEGDIYIASVPTGNSHDDD